MNGETGQLSDEERDSLRDAAFDSFGDYPEGLNELVAQMIASRERAAAKKALTEAADAFDREPTLEVWSFRKLADVLRARADELRQP